jgi:hypothetical protein
MCRRALQRYYKRTERRSGSESEATMIPEREYFLAKDEVRRRQREAAEERLVREARRNSEAARDEHADQVKRPRGAFGWLRRLAGVRH